MTPWQLLSVIAVGVAVDSTLFQGWGGARRPMVSIVGDSHGGFAMPVLAALVEASDGEVMAARTLPLAPLSRLVRAARQASSAGRPDVAIVVGGSFDTDPSTVGRSMASIRSALRPRRGIIWIGPVTLDRAHRVSRFSARHPEAVGRAMRDATKPEDLYLDGSRLFGPLQVVVDDLRVPDGQHLLTRYPRADDSIAPQVIAKLNPLLASICDWSTLEDP